MKKTLISATLSVAMLTTLALANDLIVDGKVKLGVETQTLLNLSTEESTIPVFIEVTRFGKNCLVQARAKSIYVQAENKKASTTINQVSGNNGTIITGNGNTVNSGATKVASAENVLTISASVISIECDGYESEQVRGWIYDKNGNYGVKSLHAGDAVKIGFEPVFKPNGYKMGESLKQAQDELLKGGNK